MMSHEAFVAWSYGAAALVFGVVLAWQLWDRASTKKELARLEADGIARRSVANKKSKGQSL